MKRMVCARGARRILVGMRLRQEPDIPLPPGQDPAEPIKEPPGTPEIDPPGPIQEPEPSGPRRLSTLNTNDTKVFTKGQKPRGSPLCAARTFRRARPPSFRSNWL